MHTCENCRWWIKGAERLLGTVRYVGPGQCRRLPPGANNRWPLSEKGDWCGEHSGLRAAKTENLKAEKLKPESDVFSTAMAATPAAQPDEESGAAVLSTGGAETESGGMLPLSEAEPATASKKGALAPLQPGRRGGHRAGRG